MRISIQTKYFLLAICLIGSAGIWLPIIIELIVEKKVTFHNIPQNVITYFVSLAFAGCIDLFISKLRNITIEGIANHFLNILFLFLFSLSLVTLTIYLNVTKNDGWSLFLGIIGVAISYRIWWISNSENPNFTPNNNILGGNANNELRNG